MTSSMRFRNSGRNDALELLGDGLLHLRVRDGVVVVAVNPISTPLAMSRVPRFEVMMMIVLEVHLMALCIREMPVLQDLQQRVEDILARFSISSNSTTANGLRRTASVSCPPSS